ncbi:hypothetical protein HMPREF9318_00380 [Streptococcus urinalis FB127-CNA-2]|uniref:DUF4649 domain-containing protein n=1 Tax=Streptococcus urinalis 2285-97 TaxID=764291 RepID=G5KFX2_9STRE|nr:DUF4649 family protein [Streptococcus urinalis]EHJ55763.1 hypothetical protein STRUR_1131 [Streptococcus urinalis 2285-97]EKS22182.1 hypothetical protein HMPREF9318_00380 [Streptococcus urinalis FB127-CNA-2]VEF31994.1 30S ribosomal protein S16 [Streptococcus urinalis]
MLEITYLDAGKREQVVIFDTYNEFVRSEQACWHDIHDYFKALKVVYNGHDLNFQGPYGDIYQFLLKLALTQFEA